MERMPKDSTMMLDFDHLHSILPREKDREKNQILKSIFTSSETTRKKIINSLSLRPSTVSRVVAEMIDDGILREDQNRANMGRGRPEFFLEVNKERFWCISFSIISMSLLGSVVNLGGKIVRKTEIKLNINIDSEQLMSTLKDVSEDFHSHMPEDSEFLGYGFALPGLLDKEEKNWRMVSRFPNLKKVDLSGIAGKSDYVIIERNIDSLLKYNLLHKPETGTGTTLLIHWGYGIAVSCAMEGRILQAPNGLFGEIGHWDMHIAKDGKAVNLESIIALSGILKANGWKESIDEEVISGLVEDGIFPRNDLELINRMLRGVVKNLYLTFFPDKIYILSPFISSEISNQLERNLGKQLPDFIEHTPAIKALDYRDKGEALGIANSLFSTAFEHFLEARW